MMDACPAESKIGHLCDGVPECLKAVRLQVIERPASLAHSRAHALTHSPATVRLRLRLQLRRGATCIKLCASGGVMSQIDDPMHQQFSDEELRAIVEEARCECLKSAV
jgi:imidazolonepropionase-like amidohydrolase